MSSTNNIRSLHRKVEQLLEQVRPAHRKGDGTFEDMTVFTEEERQQLEQLFEQIAPRIDDTATWPLRQLTDEELDDLDRYATIYHARVGVSDSRTGSVKA